MTGPGTLELYAENTYTGGTYLDSGTIEEWIADETVLGDPSSPIYLAGGTLEAYGTFANPVVAQAGTTSYLATAAHLHGGGMALTGAISGSGTIDCSNAPFLAGELDLSGDNSQFSGTFRIHGSTSVYFNQQSAGSDQATWDIENSAHLVANLSSNPTGRPIKLGGLSGTGAYGVLTNAGIPVTFEVGATGQSTEFDGAITNGSGSSTVALTKVGAGRLTLGGADTYTGVTTIEGGTIVFKNPTAINNVLSNAGGVNDTGGFLVFDYTGGTDPAATVLARLTAAYNGGVNSFQTGQIRDSSATTQIGLGWLDNTTTHQVIVMPAVYGDADLNGVVNSADQGTTGTTWSQGDFNYDGTVNAADQAILTANYGQTGPLNINNMP
jgi:autotransporter-associated beta strand protein